MATIRKRGDKWQAIVRLNGVNTSATRPTKAQAQAWATSTEADIISGKRTTTSDKTAGDLFDEYLKKVTPTKRGHRWEEIRIELLRRLEIEVDGERLLLGDIRLADFKEPHVAAWRDLRLKTVSGSSVNREWNILSNAFKVAQKEWKWTDRNPFHEVKRPKKNDARDRIASQDEIDQCIHSSGYRPDEPPQTIVARVMAAALFAMQTGMRCKEITRLKPSMVHLEQCYVEVSSDSKTGKREVPLSSEAKRILEQMLALGFEDTVFGLTETQVDSHWRKITSKAMVDNLTFHDSKHYACTWIAQRPNITVYELARIVGTKDLKTLMIYFNKRAKDIASSLG